MNRRPTNHSRPLSRLVGLLAVFALIAAACSEDLPTEALPASDEGQIELDAVDGEPVASTTTTTTTTAPTTTTLGRSGFAGTTITVVVFDQPTMDIIQAVTEEHFTEQTGIEVRFEQPEDVTVVDIVTVDVGIDLYDVVMINPFESPQFGTNGWLSELTPLIFEDADYDSDGFVASLFDANSAEISRASGRVVEEQLFAAPFYAESSMIMFNQQIIDDAGIDFPEAPTWQEVADIARQLDSVDTAGICLNGIPEWDQLGAALTTVVNTFGGTWWLATEDAAPFLDNLTGSAQINQADSGFRAAIEFYLELAIDAGPDNFTETGFDQCLEVFQNGNAAIWYDTTTAAPLLEAPGSPMAGNVGYARAPIAETSASGSLWTWGLAIPENSLDPQASWEFIRWATSPRTIELIAEHAPDGWNDPAVIGAATRNSHFDIPELKAATQAYGDIVLAELTAADPNNPSTTPRPGTPGIQYVGIPEFQQVGNDCSAEFSSAVEGAISVDAALDNCQAIALEASDMPDALSTPDVRGDPLLAALTKLQEQGLTSSHLFVDENGISTDPVDTTDATVSGQIPGPLAPIQAGSEVRLFVRANE